MSLLLVRHGETALNAARILQPPDTPLSPRGQAQARALAQRLARQPVVGLISSDLLRARQTAEAISLHGTGYTVALWADLRERDFGDWRGKPYDNLPQDPLRMAEAPPAGESMAVFAQRCERAWQALLALRANLYGTLVVVSHGLTIHQWLSHLPVWPDTADLGARLGNTAITVVDDALPHAVRLFNCTQHLGAPLTEDGASLSGG